MNKEVTQQSPPCRTWPPGPAYRWPRAPNRSRSSRSTGRRRPGPGAGPRRHRRWLQGRRRRQPGARRPARPPPVGRPPGRRRHRRPPGPARRAHRPRGRDPPPRARPEAALPPPNVTLYRIDPVESHFASPESPAPPKADIPDIPYLSTLIVPARRDARIGGGLTAGLRAEQSATEAPPGPEVTAIPPTAPHPNHHDVTSSWSGPPQCHIVVVGDPGEVEGPGEEGPGEGARQRAEGTAAGDGSEPKGRVVFVGAGPGAPDLLTERGARAIAAANIVIWASSLVDQRVLAHARADAEIVDSAQLPMEGVLPYYERAAPRNSPSPGSTPATRRSGAPSRSSWSGATNSAWTPRSCPGCPASPRWPPGSNAS